MVFYIFECCFMFQYDRHLAQLRHNTLTPVVGAERFGRMYYIVTPTQANGFDYCGQDGTESRDSIVELRVVQRSKMSHSSTEAVRTIDSTTGVSFDQGATPQRRTQYYQRVGPFGG